MVCMTERFYLAPDSLTILMPSKNAFRLFKGAYNLARSAKLLENDWAKRAFVSSYFSYKKYWEDPFWSLIDRQPQLFQNGDVLDVGANIGYTSCLFAGVLKPGSMVYSFEPDLDNFKMMAGVIRRKHLSGTIEAINAAVGNADGSVEFWHNQEHSGDHRVVTSHFKNSRPESSQISTVPLTSVDSFVDARKLKSISFIKIDVQGYELAVCEGMTQTLARFPELCVGCEFAPGGMAELGFDPVGLLNFFRQHGYHLYVMNRSSIRLAESNETIQQAAGGPGYVDLLCSQRYLT
jgi:FkbM family methyltransferase